MPGETITFDNSDAPRAPLSVSTEIFPYFPGLWLRPARAYGLKKFGHEALGQQRHISRARVLLAKCLVEPYKIFVEAVSTRTGKCGKTEREIFPTRGGFHAREEMRLARTRGMFLVRSYPLHAVHSPNRC